MKIEEQVLSREQMAYLQELGVDTSDSSMMWYRCDDGNTERWYLQINNELSQGIARVMKGTVSCFVPTYTIGDLIGKLPKRIWYGDCPYDNDIDLFNGCVLYENWIGCEINHTLIKTRFDDGRLIDGLYGTLCNLYENHKELIK